LYSSTQAIEEQLVKADLVIGAVLIPGKLAPRLVSKAMLQKMEPGTVLVDASIDQGGCFETSRATSHSEPTYVVDGIVHYCVPNIPGACARTATQALTNATMNYIIKLANKGYKQAMREDIHLRRGLNVCLGKVTYPEVAVDLKYTYTPAEEMI
ncbi:MAG TPA: hypothetical protein VN457_03865, partial [Chlamydiales bacterium]|nr:hypothetical protein [Chlamydiales bacterium]